MRLNRPLAFYKEIEVHHRDISDDALLEEIKVKYPEEGSLRRMLMDTKFYSDFLSAFSPPANGTRILDVGTGYGYTSVYLASMGYEVAAVEPSSSLCQFTRLLAKAQGVNLKMLNTTGEEMGDMLPSCSFDIVHFHSSLHHCDDPVEALKQAYRLLSPNGEVRLVCEPCLPIYRSKRWFHRMLLEHPDKVGHYGGNEHIYRIKEYSEMLKQVGFVNIQMEIPASLFEVMHHPGASNAMIAAKRLFSYAMKLCQKYGAIQIIKPVLDSLSLGTRIFVGKKGEVICHTKDEK